MLKKSLIVASVASVFYVNAQDISVVSNAVDVYSNTQNLGTAKFNAMAGSNGALGGDATSLLTNPAGLGVAISGDVNFTPLITTYKNTSSLNGASLSYDKSRGLIGNFGGVFTFPLMTETPWKFVNVGINSSIRNLDNYVESPGNNNVNIAKDLLDGSGNALVGNMSYLGHAYNRTGAQYNTSVGIGANYDNRLYFGAGLNVHQAEIDMYDTAIFGLDLDNSETLYSKQYTPYREESSGASFSLGVIGKVNNQLRLGASIESPVWWAVDRVYTDYYFDNVGDLYYDTFAENRNFRSPMKATLSAAYVPNKNFAMNIDYSLGLTKPHYKEVGNAEKELNEFFDENYKNVSEVKIGAEYRIKSFRLRGGYGFSSNPFGDIALDAYNANGSTSRNTYSDLVVSKRNTIGVGIGYDFKSFFIDASYQNVNTKYSNPFLSGHADYGTGYYSNHEDYSVDITTPYSVVADVKSNRNSFFLTIGWKF